MSDYISREETLKAIQPRYAPAINKVLAGIIESVPAADVKPVVRGHWIVKRFGDYAMCSVCYWNFVDAYDADICDHYCRHCGAEMVDVVQEGDGNGGGRKST